MLHTSSSPPRWMTRVLIAAGLYNLLWGAAVVLFPGLFFRLADLPQPLYPAIWQCVGMIVGVYGIGYLIAAGDPRRHWPIVLVGLLGKIFGPIGFVHAAWQGTFPFSMGWTLLTNDLIWWIPFVLILRDAARHAFAQDAADDDPRPFEALLEETIAHDGRSLMSCSRGRGALVVFLRHAGCTFCREAIADLGKRRDEIERRGRTIVLVHMGDDAPIAQLAARHGLRGAARIADPSRTLYRRFGLSRGSLAQLFGPRVVLRGIAATLRGHMLGPLQGDGLQMPGAFLLKDGRIVRTFRHRTASDRPDYCALAAASESAAGFVPETAANAE